MLLVVKKNFAERCAQPNASMLHYPVNSIRNRRKIALFKIENNLTHGI